MNKRRTIPMKEIRSIANRIAERFDVEKIILFGSYAYGRPRSFSDIDLCVVMDTDERPLKKSLEILRSLSPLRHGLDIIVRRENDFRRRIPQGDIFLKEICERGEVIYKKWH